jgi:hypothetical protein
MTTLTPFEQAVIEYAEIEQQLAQHPPRNQWRVYHDADRFVTIANGPDWPDLEYSWIEITSDQARNITQYRIVAGELKKIDKSRTNIVKLHQTSEGEYTAVAGHMALLVEPGEEYDTIKRYTKTNRHS